MNGNLRAYLFPGDFARTFAVIDGAACGDLLGHLDETQPPHVCLYAGELTTDLEEVAPYLVELTESCNFTDWLLSEGAGKNWGIFARSHADIRALRKHLRTLLYVRDPQGEQLYFRYYDPRVLRIFLPACSRPQIERVCGPVGLYLMEAEVEDSFLCFSPENCSLETLSLKTPVEINPPLHSDLARHQAHSAFPPSDSRELKITHSQMEIFSAADILKFEVRMIEHINQFFPAVAELMDRNEMVRLITNGRTRAGRYGIKSERDVCLFINVTIMLGTAFDEDPSHSWARRLLGGEASSEERATALYQTAVGRTEEKIARSF